MNRSFFLFAALFAMLSASAQNAEMADSFRQEGKIYVVIAVLGIVFVCVLGILLYIERKLSKLEKELKDK